MTSDPGEWRNSAYVDTFNGPKYLSTANDTVCVCHILRCGGGGADDRENEPPSATQSITAERSLSGKFPCSAISAETCVFVAIAASGLRSRRRATTGIAPLRLVEFQVLPARLTAVGDRIINF
uniref:Uncharacterized protein n=1 Tax=Plectus sambesii TaxID=2011161 RepID=A0A914X6J6_9BILA